MTVGFNVEETPHKNYWLNSTVIGISELPFKFARQGWAPERLFSGVCVRTAFSTDSAASRRCLSRVVWIWVGISLYCWGVGPSTLPRVVSSAQGCSTMVGFPPAAQPNFAIKILSRSLRMSLVHNRIPPEVYSSRRGFDMPAVVDKRPVQVEYVKTGAYS